MRSELDRRLADLRRALGGGRPSAINQEAFDFDPAHLHRLSQLADNQQASNSDLWAYSQDLLYSAAIDAPLLVYALPACLRAWHDDLRGANAGYGGFVEQFYPVLANRHLFDSLLTQKQTAAVSDFMGQSILEEIDDQRGLAYQGMGARPYRWIRAVMTHGVVLPDIERLWSEWWSLRTIGRAIAFAQWASVLMYADDENPIFAPWTHHGGGGAPSLWEYAGHLYTHRWLEPNVEFLKRTLTLDSVSHGLARSVGRLAGEPECPVVIRMQADFAAQAALLERRCLELPTLLATRQQPGSLLDWS